MKYNWTLKDHYEIRDMIDPIVLDDIINDCNVRLIGEMGENGEHTENELVFDGDNLT